MECDQWFKLVTFSQSQMQKTENSDGSQHTVDGSWMVKDSRHILQESSKESSKGAEEDGAEMDGMADRGEGEQVKFSMVSCTVVWDGEGFTVKKKKKTKP